MNVLYLDTETWSETPIKHGAYKYAEAAEVLLVPYAWNDEPVTVWDLTDGTRPHWREELREMIAYAGVVVIQNSAFDRTVLREQGVDIPVEKIEDTMVTALLHAFPGSLDKLGGALRLPVDKAKDKDGKRLIHLFTKPQPKSRKLRRATRETHPDDWQRFIEYAARDVDAMRSVRRLLPTWNTSAAEIDLWRLDQRINDRGISVDLELADAARRAFERTSRSLAARAAALTGGAVASLTQRDKFLAYLRQHGVDPDNLTKATVASMLEGDLPAEIVELLEIRQQAASTTPSKYTALQDATSSDGRLRGCIQFSGAARTRRDAGRIFQPQNLIRTPDWFDEVVQENTIATLKADCEDILYDNVSERCAFVVRGSLVAAPGKKFVIADLSNIEGRGLAWMAGEDWKIEAFKAYDRGAGPDLYKVTAGRILGKPPVDVSKDERQTQGKVPELAGGYGGGLGAYRTMGGKVFDAMSDDQIMEIVHAWRKAHPATKRFWYDVEGAVRCAIKAADEGKLGESFDVRGLLRIDTALGPDDVRYVRIRLPSGAYLVYRDMRIDGAERECPTCGGKGNVLAGGFVEDGGVSRHERCDDCRGTGTIGQGNGQLTYEGLNQYTRKWERLETYYGKLVENIVQSVSRDVFMSGLRRAELDGLCVVLRVHDELVCEVPDDPAYTVERLVSAMATNPSWSIGLPLKAEGFECKRYRK